MSTTSVAVVYAVMVETGFNRTDLGKIILAACFVTDLGTVLALGLVFANYNVWLATFTGVTAVVLVVLPKFAPWLFAALGERVSEPQTKFVALVLLCCSLADWPASPAARRCCRPTWSASRWRRRS
jgi:Kef-type K+ transport system membrane component KefB